MVPQPGAIESERFLRFDYRSSIGQEPLADELIGRDDRFRRREPDRTQAAAIAPASAVLLYSGHPMSPHAIPELSLPQ